MDLAWLPGLRQQLLGAFDPWVRVLSDHTRFSFDGNASSDHDTTSTTAHERALTVTISTDGAVDVRVFEALELLALLSGVDPGLFTVHVRTAALRHSAWLRLPEATALPMTCVLRIRHGDDFPTAITTWCERLVLGGVEGTASKEYANMRTLLESAYTMMDMITPPGHGRIVRDALRVRVDVQASQGEFDERVAQLAQVALMQHARDAMDARIFRHHQWKPIFCVAQMDVGIPRSISAKATLYLAQIVSCGVDVRSLAVYNMDVEHETADVFARSLQLLTGTLTHQRENATAVGTLKEINLPVFMTERTVSAMFSALMMSQSVEVVSIKQHPWLHEVPGHRSIQMTRAQRNHLWKWVALGLFSRYSAHRLKTIRLHVQDLDLDDVAAFRCALRQPEDAIVSDRETEVEGSAPFEKVAAARFTLTKPLPSMKSGFGMDMAIAAQDVWVEDKEGDPQNREWLRVVLPGCGRAWVHRDSTSIGSDAAPAAHSPMLTIGYMNERSKPAVLELLQLVGHNVKHLYIVTCNITDPLDDWLLAVVQACPHLEHLAMANGWKVTSMDVFVKMYQDLGCQVRSLRLSDLCVEHTESITRFVRLLGDKTLGMATHLHKVSLTANQLSAPLENIVQVVDTMLCSNTVLQDLHMLMSFRPPVPVADFSTVSAMCQKHRGQPVAVRKNALSLPQKSAFLGATVSVIANGSGDPQAMQRLDHRVLSLIFEFAADCETRNVSLWFHQERAADDEGEAAEQVDADEDDGFAGGGDNDRED